MQTNPKSSEKITSLYEQIVTHLNKSLFIQTKMLFVRTNRDFSEQIIYSSEQIANSVEEILIRQNK